MLELPHSQEDEMMVLGCMLTNENSLSVASDALDDSDFHCYQHGIIFSVLKMAHKSAKQTDVYLVCEELKRQEKLESVGGVSFITSLAQYAGTSAHIEEYVELVRKKSLQRKGILFFKEQERRLIQNPADIQGFIEEAYQGLGNLTRGYTSNDKASIGEILSGAKSTILLPLIQRLQARQAYFKENKTSFVTGIPTGFIDLDRQVTLLEDTNLIIIAARPAMGKTALALNIVANICFTQNLPVGLISLEMGGEQLAERLLSLMTGISGEALKRGAFSEMEFQRLQEEYLSLSRANLFIHESCPKISQLAAWARRLKDVEGIRILFVDYLQLMTADGKSDSRQYEVAEVSRRLKLLAMELRIPIVVVAQLSRKVEERKDKRPLLSDLRDSGQLEQDADAVLFIYREEYYSTQDNKGEAELFLGKNRHGSMPSITLTFKSSCGKFSDHVPGKSGLNHSKQKQQHSSHNMMKGLGVGGFE